MMMMMKMMTMMMIMMMMMMTLMKLVNSATKFCVTELTSFINLIRVCAVLGPGTRLYIQCNIYIYNKYVYVYIEIYTM